jgi:hypothetical protein
MLVLAAGLSAPGAGAEIAPADVIVTVTGGSAHSFEEAREDALRKAVEMGAGKELESLTRIADFALLHDTIVSRANGYVRVLDDLEKKEVQGVYTVRIRAAVARGQVGDDVLAIQIAYKQEGRPNFLVVCTEEVMHYLTGQPLPGTGNIAESRLRDHFLEKRFDLIDDETLARKIGREVTRAMLARDEERAVDAANRVNADYLVIVTAKGRARGPERIYGRDMWTVDADLRVKMPATDSALLVADKTAKQQRLSEDPTTAAGDALHLAVDEIWPRLLNGMLKNWGDRLINGHKIECVGRRITKSIHEAIVRNLEKVPGVKSVSTSEIQEVSSTDWVITHLKPMRLGEEIVKASGNLVRIVGYSRGRLEYEMAPVAPPLPPPPVLPPGPSTASGQGPGGSPVTPLAGSLEPPVVPPVGLNNGAGTISVLQRIAALLDNPPAWLLPAVISAVAVVAAFVIGILVARRKGRG